MSKPVVLFLAANPNGTPQLRLDQECAAITRELKMTPGRVAIDLQTRWAVTIEDIMRELNELAPTIIHFSGHGNAQGIALLDSTGTTQLVAPRALAGLIESTGKSARAVVLNACFSDEQAGVLAEHLGCAVGMRGAVSDDAALEFSVAFYRALGHDRSVYEAFHQARATLVAKQLEQRAAARCLTRGDVDASKLRLQLHTISQPPTSTSPTAPPSPPSPSFVNTAGRDNHAVQIGDVRLGDNGTVSIGTPSRK